MALTTWFSYGQISTYVLQPASLTGALDYSLATDWGMSPDMSIQANLVQGFAIIVDDGTSLGTLGCGALTNAADIAGKIAIVYRGDCEFGEKALNAQNAGAVGVVIVNNVPGAPVGMAAGTSGSSVYIPVVMISQDDGALINDEVVAGNVEMFIGTVQNMFQDNIATKKASMLIPAQAARPALVSTTNTEFEVPLGAWLFNYGSANQSGVRLKATVTHNGATVYNDSSTTSTINSGDSAYFTLPTFTQNGYDGRYEISYMALLTTNDEFPDDNLYTTTLSVDTVMSYAPLDADGLPEQTAFFRPANAGQVFQICSYFKDPNASRLRADGIYTAATVNSPAVVTGQQLDIRLFAWNDNISGLSNATFNDVSEIMNGVFEYSDSTEARGVQFIPFFEPTPLMDDQKYLFCVSTSNADMFLGHSSAVNYSQNEDATDQVNTLLNIDGQWSLGWATGEVPALGVKMVSVSVGINEQNMVELTPYPNPTSSMLRIPVNNLTGKAAVMVYDAKGAMVANKQVTVGGDSILTMDLREFNGGTYMFHLTFENGKRSSFRVVVTK